MSWISMGWLLCFPQQADTSGRFLHINADIGDGAIEDVLTRGEGGEAGYWNRILSSGNNRWDLQDTSGVQAGVTLEAQGTASWVQCELPRSAPIEGAVNVAESSFRIPKGNPLALLEDGAHSIGDRQTWTLSGLRAGTYALLLYGRPACTATDTEIQVPEGVPQTACLQKDASGEYERSSLHLFSTIGDPVEWSLEPSANAAEARLSGFQLVALSSEPDPSRSRLLTGVGSQPSLARRNVGHGVRVAIGVNATGTFPQLWVRSFATGNPSPVVLRGGLRTGGVELFPSPLTAARVAGSESMQLSLSQEWSTGALTSMSGARFWFQAWGRTSGGMGTHTNSVWLEYN